MISVHKNKRRFLGASNLVVHFRPTLLASEVFQWLCPGFQRFIRSLLNLLLPFSRFDETVQKMNDFRILAVLCKNDLIRSCTMEDLSAMAGESGVARTWLLSRLWEDNNY